MISVHNQYDLLIWLYKGYISVVLSFESQMNPSAPAHCIAIFKMCN